MARVSAELIAAFRKTIIKLKNNAPYQWGHMGACNCGNLAQEITQLSKAEIHQYAMEKHGDWNDQLVDYCPTSGYPMDLMISKMLDAGLTLDELKHLERLSDPKILAHIPVEKRLHLKKNNKEDVILYLETWTLILENEWVKQFDKNLMDFDEKNISSKVFA
ncbi:hypothetical protein [Cecembia calidifontis]|uniref:Uncharacterized protein n=1 Tax=Cecembia calidifontis TaxID=1187080 RepID=A0A4Q7PBV0_9BACT|nr:hypothetical protein [Cecembia calidifontis]RZS97685.1 hypothetical protein BC751_3303 [Cecembia calidifontis]